MNNSVLIYYIYSLIDFYFSMSVSNQKKWYVAICFYFSNQGLFLRAKRIFTEKNSKVEVILNLLQLLTLKV